MLLIILTDRPNPSAVNQRAAPNQAGQNEKLFSLSILTAYSATSSLGQRAAAVDLLDLEAASRPNYLHLPRPKAKFCDKYIN